MGKDVCTGFYLFLVEQPRPDQPHLATWPSGKVSWMNLKDLVTHQAELAARVQAIEMEKSQLMRKLKAIDVLLEGEARPSLSGLEMSGGEPTPALPSVSQKTPRKRNMARHAVRFSPRISLIGAVEEAAMKQPGVFDSNQILAAIQNAYPEFHLSETKHISSPLSDLVKRGVLAIERERSGKMPNVYRFIHKQS
jgi:hypothetical protein